LALVSIVNVFDRRINAVINIEINQRM